jgi:hypothetical protein
LLDPGAVLACEQAGTFRQPVVIEHSLHPLLPLATLIDERVTQPHPRTKIQEMVRRDPALRHPAGHQQLPQMPRVRPVVLRVLLVPAQRARLRRLRQMNLSADPAELLDHEPPARRRLQRHLELQTLKPGKEPDHTPAVSRHDPTTRHLARHRIDPLRGDLRPMLIKSHHDRHTSSLLPSNPDAQAAFSPTHHIPWVTVGPSHFE